MPPRRTQGPPRLSLLRDKDIVRWHANVSRGSPITADVYARRLAAFCEQMKVDPTALVTLSEKALRDLLLDFVTEEEKKNRAGSYIQSSTKAVKSWLIHNGVKLSLPVRIRGASDTPTLREERTPTQEELRAILLAAARKDRVSCALMAFSGVRPEVLGNYRGTDGLRLRDVDGLKVGAQTIEFERIPAIIEVRKELSKAGHRYFSFIGEEGCGYIQQYLEERLRAGEKLVPETDLIHPKGSGGFHDKAFVTTINIGDGVRKAIRGAGFKWRPYVLRAYFDTQLLLAESKGKLAHDYRVFWMGHKGSMEARYNTNKGRLPVDLLDDMREAYGRCESFLSTMKASRYPDDTDLKRAILSVFLPEDEVAKLDVTKLSGEEVRTLVTDRVRGSPNGPSASVGASPLVPHSPDGLARGSTVPVTSGRAALVSQPREGAPAAEAIEEVVALGELKSRLASGWTLVSSLGNGEAVLRRPR